MKHQSVKIRPYKDVQPTVSSVTSSPNLTEQFVYSQFTISVKFLC